MNYIDGKVIIITGAARGFGKILAERSASLGAKVVAADIDDSALNDVVKAINENGGDALNCPTDVRNAKDMRRLAQVAVEHYKQIDVMLNNAGIMPLAFFSDHNEAIEAWSRCIDINLKGVLNGIAAVYDQMIDQGRGHIVNMSSIYANQPVQGAGVYGATKAAVAFLSDSLRQESHGRIKVTTVRPTGVPGTGIADNVINPHTHIGLLGSNVPLHDQIMGNILAGEVKPEWEDENNIAHFPLSADNLVDQVLYAINQPWGVSISEITVRASGDMFVI